MCVWETFLIGEDKIGHLSVNTNSKTQSQLLTPHWRHSAAHDSKESTKFSRIFLNPVLSIVSVCLHQTWCGSNIYVDWKILKTRHLLLCLHHHTPSPLSARSVLQVHRSMKARCHLLWIKVPSPCHSVWEQSLTNHSSQVYPGTVTCFSPSHILLYSMLCVYSIFISIIHHNYHCYPNHRVFLLW